MEYNYITSQTPDKGVQVGPEPTPTPNATLAMTQASVPGFGGNLIESDLIINGIKSAVYKSTAYPANADGKQRPGAVVEYSSEFSVGEGFDRDDIASLLPKDYLAADFVQFDGNDYVVLPFASKAGDDLQMSTSVQFFKFLSRRQGEGKAWNPMFYYGLENGVWIWALNSTVSNTNIEEDSNWHNVKLAYSRAFSGFSLDDFSVSTTYNAASNVLPSGLCLGIFLNSLDYAYLRKKETAIIINDNTEYNLVPAVNMSGMVVLFNTITGESVNSNYKRMRAGLTLAQARKLGQLPSSEGATIRLALPTNYQEDASVVAVLAEVESKGWILNIDTYEAGAISSAFAMKRVLVRKTSDTEGNYVDAQGVRYFVENTQTIIGADPQELGYEPFRSVEAATEYWGLTPWVNPEPEEEVSQEL